MGVVYKILNIVTGDFYIGSSVYYINRKHIHITELNNKKHHNIILQNSWNKHGENSFVFEIIEKVEKENLISREQHYIDTLKPKYNIAKIAGSPLGVKHTEQSKNNMSKAHLGKKLSKESIIKRTASVKGTKRNSKTIQLMRTKQCIVILQYDLNDKFIKEWFSIAEACRSLNLKNSHISECCRNIRKTSGGFKRSYKDKNLLIKERKKLKPLTVEQKLNLSSKLKNHYKNGGIHPLKGVKLSKESIKNHKTKVSKPVLQFDLNNNFLNEWSSIKEAANNTDSGMNSIINSCKNRVKKHVKYIWKYKQ